MSIASLVPNAVGLGLRRSLLGSLQAAPADSFDFLEAAPENWIGVGGVLGKTFSDLVSRHPLICHGLSLSIGGPAELNETFLGQLRQFLDRHGVSLYSEHLSACGDSRGQLYDLLPVPFTEAAVKHVAARIRRTQDILGRRIAVENISYYAAPFQAMTEIDFINAVLAEADCDLLLDVNNIIVNATNHGYDAHAFLHALPVDRIAYVHIAGHYDEAEDLKIDTHGAAVNDRVWSLLGEAYRLFGAKPTLLERDFNFPPFADLLGELDRIRHQLSRAQGADRYAA